MYSIHHTGIRDACPLTIQLRSESQHSLCGALAVLLTRYRYEIRGDTATGIVTGAATEAHDAGPAKDERSYLAAFIPANVPHIPTIFFFFFLNEPPPPEISPFPLHAPLPI